MVIIDKVYSNYRNLIQLIKDVVYFSGIIGFIKYLFDRNFVKKCEEIEKDKVKRAKLEERLLNYVLTENKHGMKDIGIRFIYWKNYPWKLNDDGYKFFLRIKYDDTEILSGSWIDKTGIYFKESEWFWGRSVYLNTKNKIFFGANGGQKFKNFKELKEAEIIKHLPFSNITNFDFKEYIEYEPIFYVKYKYIKQKLFDKEKVITIKNVNKTYPHCYQIKKSQRYFYILNFNFLKFLKRIKIKFFY